MCVGVEHYYVKHCWPPASEPHGLRVVKHLILERSKGCVSYKNRHKPFWLSESSFYGRTVWKFHKRTSQEWFQDNWESSGCRPTEGGRDKLSYCFKAWVNRNIRLVVGESGGWCLYVGPFIYRTDVLDVCLITCSLVPITYIQAAHSLKKYHRFHRTIFILFSVYLCVPTQLRYIT